nr:flavin-containing monooxygenase fmo gs-ox-like 5 [Quercus suber]
MSRGRGHVVVVIGSSESAFDISQEIATVAKEVHIAARTVLDGVFGKQLAYDNMWLHPMIEGVNEDCYVNFQDGSFVIADIILHCTGYKYHFPFLETNGVVTVDDNRVGPLYKHVFPPTLAPWLSFVGLTYQTIPFPISELQSKWIAGLLSNRFTLPSQEEMIEDVETFYSSLEASGTPKRYTHRVANIQVGYNTWLAGQYGCPAFEEWRKQMCYELMTLSSADSLNLGLTAMNGKDRHLVLQAQKDFIKYTPNQVSDIYVSQ